MTIGALLGVAFIVLKVIGEIDWPWWLVVAPIWGEFVLWAIFLVLTITGIIFTSKK